MKVLVKGAGDLASGVAVQLKRRGYQVIMTEIETPLTVRRQVAFSRAVYEKEAVVEDEKAVLVENYEQAKNILKEGNLPVIIDPNAGILKEYKPEILVDAIIAKRNIGTKITDAPYVIGLGPGFCAGKDCHAVIETMRGETLAKPIYEGEAIVNTGVPGMIGGYAKERLLKAMGDGMMNPQASIGDHVKKGQIVAYTGEKPVIAQIDGIVRGMLQEGVQVKKGLKIGDVDPRDDESLVYAISDKSNAIGEGVVEAIERLTFQSFGIVILAAGKSKRYGSNKLLEIMDGKKMYQHLLDKISRVSVGTKVIVTRFPEIEEAAEDNKIAVIKNDDPDRGISYSLKLGMKKCMQEDPKMKGILFIVCDQPYIRRQTLKNILDMAAKNPGKIIAAAYHGKIGNPVFFDHKYWKELLALTGDIGGKQILKKYEDQILFCEADKRELQDIDDPSWRKEK